MLCMLCFPPGDPLPVRAGNTALSGQYLSVLPYKLLHTYALVDLGLVQQAIAYCGSLNTTLQVRALDRVHVCMRL